MCVSGLLIGWLSGWLQRVQFYARETKKNNERDHLIRVFVGDNLHILSYYLELAKREWNLLRIWGVFLER